MHINYLQFISYEFNSYLFFSRIQIKNLKKILFDVKRENIPIAIFHSCGLFGLFCYFLNTFTPHFHFMKHEAVSVVFIYLNLIWSFFENFKIIK